MDPFMLFPLLDEQGQPIVDEFAFPIELFWDDIDDRVIKCTDPITCIIKYGEWKLCVSDTTQDPS